MAFMLNNVIILFGISLVSGYNNCECNKDAGIFCRYRLTYPGPACVDFKDHGFSAEEKKLIIHKMNKYRSKVALGKEKLGRPGPQPPAADMMEVTWNNYLESTAQRYADQCVFRHSPGDCRKIEEYWFGENIAWGRGISSSTYYLDYVDAWYKEVQYFPSYLVDSYKPAIVKLKKGEQIGHYAQFLNSKTYHVGCGKTRWKNENILVCHYGPTVYLYKPLYTRGRPASKCINGTKSSYKGLCGSGSVQDQFRNPVHMIDGSGSKLYYYAPSLFGVIFMDVYVCLS